jgi:hypothetical protein
MVLIEKNNKPACALCSVWLFIAQKVKHRKQSSSRQGIWQVYCKLREAINGKYTILTLVKVAQRCA